MSALHPIADLAVTFLGSPEMKTQLKSALARIDPVDLPFAISSLLALAAAHQARTGKSATVDQLVEVAATAAPQIYALLRQNTQAAEDRDRAAGEALQAFLGPELEVQEPAPDQPSIRLSSLNQARGVSSPREIARNRAK